jgi:hypothetical protein
METPRCLALDETASLAEEIRVRIAIPGDHRRGARGNRRVVEGRLMRALVHRSGGGRMGWSDARVHG